VIIAFLLMALTGYFGWLLGRRFERGKVEREQEHYKELYASGRKRRSGGIQLKTMQIRR
jgi:hypothetical protein